MHWLSCILRFLRSALALPLGSWGPKLFFNSPTSSEQSLSQGGLSPEVNDGSNQSSAVPIK